MSWQKFKENKLAAYQNAKLRGEVDGHIEKLIERINRNAGLVSLSSCSGRIVLLMVGSEGKKTASFFGKWHKPVDVGEFELKLANYTGKKPLWFRVEPFILHVTAMNVESAKGFMEKVRTAGVKRGGVQTIKKDKVTIEVQGSGYLAMPVDPVSEWNGLIKTANKIMNKNLKMLKKLEKVKW